MTANQIAYRNYQEAVRSHMASEQQARNELEETKRRNLVSEAETYRSNVANEQLKHETNVINAQHYQRSDAEAARHNAAVESETKRHNVVTEAISVINATTDRLKAGAAVTTAKAKSKDADTNYLKTQYQHWENKEKLDQGWAELGIKQGTLDITKSKTASEIEKNTAQTEVFKAQVPETRSKTILNVTQSMYNVLNTAKTLVQITKPQSLVPILK